MNAKHLKWMNLLFISRCLSLCLSTSLSSLNPKKKRSVSCVLDLQRRVRDLRERFAVGGRAGGRMDGLTHRQTGGSDNLCLWSAREKQ